jgi:hypothetical protein
MNVGIAGVNTRPLLAASLGVAGNWGSTLRPHLAGVLGGRAPVARYRLGDQAAASQRAVFLLDYTYLSCPERRGMRWRPAFAGLLAPAVRARPLYLDSGAFREHAGTAPDWAGYRAYCQAIDLLQPTGAMAKDTVGDQAASKTGWERMVSDGYRDLVIPVWQVRQAYQAALSPEANARAAAADPVLKEYCGAGPLVALGGLAKGKDAPSPVPREQRGRYLAELCARLPGVHFWALGQASPTVLNDLAKRGVLDRVWTDSSWWIHSARAERMAILDNGRLSEIRFDDAGRAGQHTFLTLVENMAVNLRALLAAYAGLLSYPGPPTVPSDPADPTHRAELARRVRADLPAQLPLGLEVGGEEDAA